MQKAPPLYRLFGVIVFCILFIYGCATTPQAPSIPPTLEPNVALKDLCNRYGLSCILDNDSQVITIQDRNIQVRAMIGSDVVMMDKNKLSLSSPVRIEHGIIYVPADFRGKVIEPLVKRVSASKESFTVMIDAGHGGNDPGGIGYLGTKEKIIDLDIVRRLKANLEERGLNVKMTRSDDNFISLERRAEMTNRKNINLFVSIHANISKSRKIKGIEVYCLRELDAAERKEAMDPAKYEGMFSEYKMKQDDMLLKKTLIAMMADYKNYESDRLSRYLAKEVSETVEMRNRGDKQAGFYVLKYTLVPSVLIEVGFLSNKIEERNLQSGEYRQKIVNGIADSLIRYAKDHSR
ncbi:MAG: N-acetylmuramoyl-L-alanine amidase [Candidatus Omnitrophica bacterium]|nr:N-acetylmuramoyl-L-alanine amidase [Candidatus Omnitrophota bacterium]